MSIKRSEDGLALGIVASDGTTTWYGWFDEQDFDALDQTLDAVNAATRANVQAKAKYLNDLNTFQVNVSAGRATGLTAPVKPEKQVVSDPAMGPAGYLVPGVVSLVAFVPALPDAVYLNIPPGATVMG